MPTARELDLFSQCDGGSGDANTDAALARSLGDITDIPEHQVVSFIRTRNRNSVEKLRNVLQDMPESRSPSARSQSLGSSKSASKPRSSQSNMISESLGLNRRQNAQARLLEMGVMKTSYGDVHGRMPGGTPKSQTPSVAFDSVIRRDYKPHSMGGRSLHPRARCGFLQTQFGHFATSTRVRSLQHSTTWCTPSFRATDQRLLRRKQIQGTCLLCLWVRSTRSLKKKLTSQEILRRSTSNIFFQQPGARMLGEKRA